MTFHVGQKVVCVDDHFAWLLDEQKAIQRGEEYTVRWVGVSSWGNPAIRLAGIDRTEFGASNDEPYRQARFRPLVSKSIQLFRDIAQGVSDGKPIVPDDPQHLPLSPEEVNSMIGGGGLRI